MVDYLICAWFQIVVYLVFQNRFTYISTYLESSLLEEYMRYIDSDTDMVDHLICAWFQIVVYIVCWNRFTYISTYLESSLIREYRRWEISKVDMVDYHSKIEMKGLLICTWIRLNDIKGHLNRFVYISTQYQRVLLLRV